MTNVNDISTINGLGDNLITCFSINFKCIYIRVFVVVFRCFFSLFVFYCCLSFSFILSLSHYLRIFVWLNYFHQEWFIYRRNTGLAVSYRDEAHTAFVLKNCFKQARIMGPYHLPTCSCSSCCCLLCQSFLFLFTHTHIHTHTSIEQVGSKFQTWCPITPKFFNEDS